MRPRASFVRCTSLRRNAGRAETESMPRCPALPSAGSGTTSARARPRGSSRRPLCRVTSATSRSNRSGRAGAASSRSGARAPQDGKRPRSAVAAQPHPRRPLASVTEAGTTGRAAGSTQVREGRRGTARRQIRAAQRFARHGCGVPDDLDEVLVRADVADRGAGPHGEIAAMADGQSCPAEAHRLRTTGASSEEGSANLASATASKQASLVVTERRRDVRDDREPQVHGGARPQTPDQDQPPRRAMAEQAVNAG
jgi:hypothetical protein